MRIHKAKFKPNGDTLVSYSIRFGDGWEKNPKESPAKPLPSFIEAMGALKPFVMKACALNDGVEQFLEVTGLHLTYKGESSVTFVVTAKYPSPGSSSPCNVTTPRRTFWSDIDDSPEDQVDSETSALVQAVIDEAERFANGEYEQPDLDVQTDQEAVA